VNLGKKLAECFLLQVYFPQAEKAEWFNKVFGIIFVWAEKNKVSFH